MATRIKICGISNLADAEKAVVLGADALGFVFAESPRKVQPEMVREITQSLPPFISKVGVFVNEKINTVNKLFDECLLDIVQLHGDENTEYINSLSLPFIKAFRVNGGDIIRKIKGYEIPYFLLDTFVKDLSGGTGISFDWQIAKKASQYGKVILSGGLNPDNICNALETVQPYAIDVSSGIEKSPGIKDHQKMEKLFREVHQWDNRIN